MFALGWSEVCVSVVSATPGCKFLIALHATVPLTKVGMDERVPDLIVLSSDLAAGGWKNALSGNKTMFVNPGKFAEASMPARSVKLVFLAAPRTS